MSKRPRPDEPLRRPCDAVEYRDPEADIVLISEDGVEFRIQSFYLKAHSHFFREMFGIAGAVNDTYSSTEPILIEASRNVLKLFLDYMTHRSTSPDRNWHHNNSVVKLCIKYDCPTVKKLAFASLTRAASEFPWKVFCIASRYGNLDVARTAISQMDKEPRPPDKRHWGYPHMKKCMISGCEPSYLVAFLHVASENLQGYEPGSRNRRYDWSKAAKAFRPID